MPSITSLLLLTLTSLAGAEIHTVEVGENNAGEKGLYFSPTNITASVGDAVIFHFYPQHDVTQGPFDKPCTPTDGGFYSGAYSDTDDGKKKFVMNVTTSDPIYFYCSVAMHCKNGMVGGINIPAGDKDIAAFAVAASKASAGVHPSSLSGGELMDDAQIAALTSTVSSTATPASTAAASSTTAQASTSPTGGAAIIKGSVGMVAVAVGGLAMVL